MSEERIQNITSPQPEEQEIDLIELAQKVWASRKLVFKACGIAALVGLVVAFSIPKEYSTSVTLAPESGGKSGGGSMGALAAMAGINLGTSSGEDALSPELYPDIVSSTPFLIELFDVKVKDQKAKVDTTLYAYLKEEQRSPWWSAIFSAPFKVLGWTLSLFKDEPEEGDAKLDPFRLTRDESAIADALSKRISVSVDKKTGVTTLSVTMQDPLISASLTDTVMHCLQNYITDYRTNKARHDLAFTEKLYGEAKASYESAQKKYDFDRLHVLGRCRQCGMDIICKRFIKGMEKANNMMTDNDMMCWHALYTAPKSEHKLMQRLNAAGYTTYCPMQAVFVKWKGHIRKVITPLFSGCLFVAGNVSEVTLLASLQKAAILVNNEGKSLSIEACKAELPAKFAQLLKL